MALYSSEEAICASMDLQTFKRTVLQLDLLGFENSGQIETQTCGPMMETPFFLLRHFHHQGLLPIEDTLGGLERLE